MTEVAVVETFRTSRHTQIVVIAGGEQCRRVGA
jgi:hypothetical protein